MFQQTENQTQIKREEFSVEIRNKSRAQIFQSKRNHITKSIFEVKFVYIKKEIIDSINDNNQLPQFLKETIVTNNPPLILETLKALSDKKLSVYKALSNQPFEFFIMVAQTIQITDEYLSYLAYFNLLNLIFSLNEQQEMAFIRHQYYVQILESIKQSTFHFISNQSAEVAAFGLFTLANLMSNSYLYKVQTQLQELHQQTLTQLYQCHMKLQIYTTNYAHGLLWFLRNLCQISNKCDISMLDIISTLTLQFEELSKPIYIEMAEDFLIIVEHITKDMSDDELSELFNSKIQLMVFLITTQWPKQLLADYGQILRNILHGQDDVIEQMMGLGLSEQIVNLLKSNSEQIMAIAIGCIGNLFGAEDQDLIIQFIQSLNFPLIKELLLFIGPGIHLDIRNEASFALHQLLVNYRESAEIILNLNGIQQIVIALNDNIREQETIIYLLQCLTGLYHYEQQSFKAQLSSYGGQQILIKFLESQNEQISNEVNQLLQIIELE